MAWVALMNSGAKVHELTIMMWGQSAVHEAAGAGSQGLLDVLIKKGVKVDVRDEANQTALHYATQSGQLAMVKYLVEVKRLDVNESGREGKTPLHYAADGGYTDVVSLLLANGADPRKTNNRAHTPIQSASLSLLGFFSKVRQLLEEASKGA
jgi:ankyrin repeat protein